MFLFCVQPTSTASHQRSFGFAQVWKTTCVLYQSMKSVSSLVAEFWSPYQPFTLWLAATHQCSVRNWKEKAVESVDAKRSTSGEPRSSWTGSRGRRGNSQEMQGFVCDLYPSYKRNPSWALVWLEKTALNSKPIPQFDITNYLALISRSYSIRIRGQTFWLLGWTKPIFFGPGCSTNKKILASTNQGVNISMSLPWDSSLVPNFEPWWGKKKKFRKRVRKGL